MRNTTAGRSRGSADSAELPMKSARLSLSQLGTLLFGAGVLACSVDVVTPESTAGAGGGGASGGSGAPSGGAGAAQGGMTTTPQAGVAGQLSPNGGAGGGGGISGGGAGASTGGSAGGGAAGASGQGGSGGSAQPEAELNGAGWTMKCSKPDSDPNAGDRCWLLPPGENTCPQAGYTSVDRTLKFGGVPGTTYRVTIRFQGTHEAGDYTGGTAEPKQFLRGATHNNGGLHTWLSMEVSSPAATYNPNAGGNGGSVQVYDYSATIDIDAGATIRLKAFDIDCLMHRYCQDGDIANCKGLVVPGISPAEAPIDGSFLQMSVTSVVPK
jgi:hypothetical protein